MLAGLSQLKELPAVYTYYINTLMQNPNVFELFLYIGHSQIDTLHSSFEIAQGTKESEKARESVKLPSAVCILQKVRHLCFTTVLHFQQYKENF